MAKASRSVSFEILPSAAIASSNTSSASLSSPLASVTDTPSFSKFAAIALLPVLALYMFFFSLVIEPVIVSRETSTSSDMY